MQGGWMVAVPAIAVTCLILVVPGLAVRLAGWNARSVTPYLLVPAISVALIAASANLASIVGVDWSLLPVAAITLLAAAGAYGFRRWVGAEDVPRPTVRTVLAAGGGLVLAGCVLAFQLTQALIGPENISQTFDNIVHLNAIRLALDSSNASAFTIGATSDIGFYPNGWHSVVTLTAQVTGVTVPVAVNSANIAICALVWPASAMALSSALFSERPAAVIASAALATGFGAFPLLLLYFGVLYPNMLAYAVLPAALAVVVQLLRERRLPAEARTTTLLLVLAVGVGLSHPNAFLALTAFAFVMVAWTLGLRAYRLGTRTAWRQFAITTSVLIVVGGVLWLVGRTGPAMSGWAAWQSAAQALGEAALLSPRAYPVTVVTAAALLIGIAATVRDPRRYLTIAIPLLVASVLFIAASGIPAGTRLRDLLTNPWYNDSFRLAALLPIAGIPVAVLGVLAVVDAARRVAAHRTVPRGVGIAAGAALVVVLFSVGAGPNVTALITQTRGNYALTDDAALLSRDERTLIERLPETTPPDALIAANPWTGASLAYALAGRQVVDKHAFGIHTDDESYLNANLDDIDRDAEVCAAVDRTGVSYVLDFGSRNVFYDDGVGLDHDGLNDLEASPHLVLVDSEGPDARLFRIEGC